MNHLVILALAVSITTTLAGPMHLYKKTDDNTYQRGEFFILFGALIVVQNTLSLARDISNYRYRYPHYISSTAFFTSMLKF